MYNLVDSIVVRLLPIYIPFEVVEVEVVVSNNLVIIEVVSIVI